MTVKWVCTFSPTHFSEACVTSVIYTSANTTLHCAFLRKFTGGILVQEESGHAFVKCNYQREVSLSIKDAVSCLTMVRDIFEKKK